MFSKHSLRHLRYGVCVLEAEEPSECPSKVKLSIKHQQGRCRAWGAAYKKVTTFRFTGESDLDTSDPFACPSCLPHIGWHTSHVPDPVTHAGRKHPPVFSSSGVPSSTSSTSPMRGPVQGSSSVPCSASSAYSVSGYAPTTSQHPDPFPSTSHKHKPVHSPDSVSGYAPTTSQHPVPITCTSHVAGLDLEPLLRAYSRSREDTEMRVSITRRGGWKSTMLVPLEDFLQRLARRGLEGKKFILRVSEEDKAIDVEAALTPPGEVEDVREGDFYGREMDVMATEAEGRKYWKEDEERQDQESDGGRQNESAGEQEPGDETGEDQGQDAFRKETERVWEGNEGTRKKTVMGERVNAEHTKEVETDKTKRKVKDTKDEGAWKGNKEARKNGTAMGGRVNTKYVKEEVETDVRMQGTATEGKEESSTRAILKGSVRESNHEDTVLVKEAKTDEETQRKVKKSKGGYTDEETKRKVKATREDNTTQTKMKDSVKEPNIENITSAKEMAAKQEPSGRGLSEVTGRFCRFCALLLLLFVSLLVLLLSVCADCDP